MRGICERGPGLAKCRLWYNGSVIGLPVRQGSVPFTNFSTWARPGSLEVGERATMSSSTQQLYRETMVRALRGAHLAQGIVAFAGELVVSSDLEGSKL